METLAQTFNHRHAQFALAGHDLTDATRSAQKRHKVSARQTMWLQQIGQQIGQRRRFARPARAFLRLDKASLRYHARSIGSLVRLHQLADKRLGGFMIGLVLDNYQRCPHHTVSASTLS
jgi:hypothetical protein